MQWRSGALIAAVCLVIAAPCFARAGAPGPAGQERAQEQPPGDDGRQPSVKLGDLIPPVRLGARVGVVAQNLGVADAVVIVSDAPSYGAAMRRWSLAARFPVLIDDGSPRAREDIARFVRAFRPAQVVRWSAPDEELAAWRGGADARRAAFDEVVLRSWRTPEGGGPDGGVPDGDGGAAAQWRALGFLPPGVVAASMDDPAWTAALALAAGRGQPVAWVDAREVDGGVSGEMSLAAADALGDRVVKACEESGYEWAALGDVIDGVTICLNWPARVRVGDDRKYLALTDVVGRTSDTLDRHERWAWAGQVFGSEAEAAYRAMSALFLQPRRAWLFDGYGDDPPWNVWDMIAAKAELERAEFDVMIDDGGRRGRRDWVLRSAGKAGDQDAGGGMGVDAGLICVNSHGHAFEFNLDPGKLRAEGAPFLHVPAAVFFVHSFSAMRQGDRNTVAGRWLERGAFAYCGSVDEPHLQGFMPTPMFARRMVSAVPFGAAVRLDEPHPYARVWKVHVVGDPLFTLHDVAPRREAGTLRQGAEDVNESMKAALKAGRFAEAVRRLVILGRDEDAVRVVRAIAAADQTNAGRDRGKEDAPRDGQPGDEAVGDVDAELTADIAEPALMAAFREGDLDLFVRLGNLLADAGPLAPAYKDAVWHALRPALGTLRPQELALLKRSVREEMAADDVIQIADAVRSVQGAAAARAYLDEGRDLVTDEAGRKRVDEAMSR